MSMLKDLLKKKYDSAIIVDPIKTICNFDMIFKNWTFKQSKIIKIQFV